MNDKPAKIEIVTLKQLCTELKIDPREARERLRLAVRDVKKCPELAKSHKPGHGWEWPKNSAAVQGGQNGDDWRLTARAATEAVLPGRARSHP